MLPSYLDTPEDVPQARAAGADVVLEKSIDTPTLVEQIHILLSPTA
jgi:CheY-like chemotaxis protein